MGSVLVRGEGIAASCCHRLLSDAGIQVTCESVPKPKVPAILLSEAGQKLLADVFKQPNLFNGCPRITKRFVSWGPTTGIVALPHSAVLMHEYLAVQQAERPMQTPDWTIIASKPLPSQSVEHHFGSRTATASEVRLKATADREACWIESVENGWLFLLPGWLLSVGGPTNELLAESRLIAGEIQEALGPGQDFPCHPRIIDPLCQPAWIACGTAAVSFDPLCGDGVAYSAREAILACAVIRSAMDGGDTASLLDHYRTRLIAGFKKHLEVCREFYRSGHRGPWWDEQRNGVEQGIEWCKLRLNTAPDFTYRLNGFSLEPVTLI